MSAGAIQADRDRVGRTPWAALLMAVLVALAGGLIVVLGDRLSFFNDDWYFLFQRPGLESKPGIDSILAPHNSNLVAAPALIYKGLVAVFGLSEQAPFRVTLALFMCALGVVMYLLVSRRLGPVIGLACAAVTLYLGAAWEDLLFFASIDLIGSLVLGFVTLLVLENESPRRRVAACVALTVAVAFSNVGIAFMAGVTALLMLRRRISQLWIVLVPLAVFATWWLGYGHSQPSHLSFHNVVHLPGYLWDSGAAGLASLTGLSGGQVGATYTRGHVLIIVAVVMLAVCVSRGWRPSPDVLAPVVTLAAFWGLTGASFYAGREPFASRYQLIDVTLLIVIAAYALRAPARRVVSGAVLVLAVAVVASNLAGQLTEGYDFLATQARYVRTDLGVLQARRRVIPPDLWLTQSTVNNPYLSGITGARYLAETAAHGVPEVATLRHIRGESAAVLQSADGVLIATGVIRDVPASTTTGRACRRVGNETGDVASEASVGPGPVSLHNLGSAGIALQARLLAPANSGTPFALVAPHGTAALIVRADPFPGRWLVKPYGSSPAARVSVDICTP